MPGQRILDFGCASGRMIRYFEDVAGRCEIWGVDINAEHITWCQQHLSPPFNFATTTTFPHLPFEDRSFDLIYCGSVFTHIADLADFWLLKLKRIARENARLYIIIHDNHSMELLLSGAAGPAWLSDMLREFVERSGVSDGTFTMFTINRGPNSAQVFYDIDYIRRHWGRHFRIHSITQEAYGKQTAVLLGR
ncbi:class I SAM-dependent methyltransferase [Tautonia plasticadhaerens]|uniref:class I SAM-dependent methyltransferase n=1 Tax=Tautonia plasticadhaerens TaxID=2527974 RepID=UPI0018D202CF|nr:class I SAM-dependent methyltransferase [Tautonia plasticadhaerens]